jgi:hypothetical protein
MGVQVLLVHILAGIRRAHADSEYDPRLSQELCVR